MHVKLEIIWTLNVKSDHIRRRVHSYRQPVLFQFNCVVRLLLQADALCPLENFSNVSFLNTRLIIHTVTLDENLFFFPTESWPNGIHK
jgi:hypothetical protein